MQKRFKDELPTKAKKREIKKRPRMQIHGKSLKLNGAHAGKKISSL